MQQVLDVRPAQFGGIVAAVRTHPQTLRDPLDGPQPLPGVSADVFAASLRQIIEHPHLGGGAQPRLTDGVEIQDAALPERREIPYVLRFFGVGVQDQPAGLAGEPFQERPEEPARRADPRVEQGGQPLCEEHVAHALQLVLVRPAVHPGAFLQSEQHLVDDQRGQTSQVHNAGLRFRWCPGPPLCFVDPRVSFTGVEEPLVVGGAVRVATTLLVPVTGVDFASSAGWQRLGSRVRKELCNGEPPPALPIPMTLAQLVARRDPLPRAVSYLASLLDHPRLRRDPCDVRGGQSVLGEAPRATGADLGGCSCRVLAVRRQADPASEQPVVRRQAQRKVHRIPPRFGQKRGVEAGGEVNPRDSRPVGNDADQAGQHRRPHRRVPLNARGLGTRSTAARSREGSGCR